MSLFVASHCAPLAPSPAALAMRIMSTDAVPFPRPASPPAHFHRTLQKGRCAGRSGLTSPKRGRGHVAASGTPPGHGSFELSSYIEAKVEHVRYAKDRGGHIVFLKLMDDTRKVVPVYIGDAECASLIMHMDRRGSTRPLTHDLMKSSLEAVGFRVTKVCVTALVGNTFHGSVHYLKTGPGAAGTEEIVVDARPSDAINLAVRFGAALFVNKEVAEKTAVVMDTFEIPRTESRHEIIESVKKQVMNFNDPTYMHKLQMQLAVEEERYDDAIELRDTIDNIMTTNRELALIVAMESALNDERFEEAAALCEKLKELQGEETEKRISDGA